MIFRNTGGDTYAGTTYAEVVEAMRASDAFDPQTDLRTYARLCVERAGLLGKTMRVSFSPWTETEEVARRFIVEAIRVGLLTEEVTS